MKIKARYWDINNWESTFVFDFVFYDCTTETEPKYPISYLILDAALGGPISRTVTLPNTTGQYYIEYCKPYFFSWKPTATPDVVHFADVPITANKLVALTVDPWWFSPFTQVSVTNKTAGDLVIPPAPWKAMSELAWVTIADFNPITSDTVGPSITMSTSSDVYSAKLTLKKELMVEDKDATVVTVAPLTEIELLKGN